MYKLISISSLWKSDIFKLTKYLQQIFISHGQSWGAYVNHLVITITIAEILKNGCYIHFQPCQSGVIKKSGSSSTYINLSTICYFIYLCKNNKTVVSVVWNKVRLISNQENFEKSDIKALKWCKLFFVKSKRLSS